MDSLIVFTLSFMIPLFLLYMIYSKDLVKERPLALLKALLGGFAVAIIITLIFGSFNTLGFNLNDLSKKMGFFSYFFRAFILSGFIEEALKLLAFIFLFKDTSDYDDAYDGIVYASFIAMGFALLENVLYFISYEKKTILLFRTFTSLPLHFYCGIFMGYYYSRYLIHKEYESPKAKEFKLKSFLVPFLIHSLYNLILFVFSDINGGVAQIVLLLILGGYFATLSYLVFMNVNKSSRYDRKIKKINIKRFENKSDEAYNKEVLKEVYCSQCGTKGYSGSYCRICGKKL